MKITKTPIKDLIVIELNVFSDSRGFFVERFNEARFKENGLPTYFPQDNHSRSAPGVVRGLHAQYDPPQGKLVGVTNGSIWDVAVDVRPDSPTFGQYFGIELTGENGKLLWIPGGFAHGFCVIGDKSADVMYKVTALYHKEGETGIIWNDPELAIDWPVRNPIISDRDTKMPSFTEYKKNPPNWK